MTIIDKLRRRPSRQDLLDKIEILKIRVDDTANALAAANIDRERLTRDAAVMADDPTGKSVLARVLRAADPQRDLCMLGPNGCESHFGERDCSVAWARSYLAGHMQSSPGAASLQLMLASVGDSLPTLIAALTEYADNHEPEGAGEGDEAVEARRTVRRARELIHAANGGPTPTT